MKSAIDTAAGHIVRFASTIDGRMINSGPVLKWLHVEDGPIVQLKDEAAINTPAVAAALAVEKYEARAEGEISLEVGDIISIIAMPEDCSWWKGKRAFQVGLFPRDCVVRLGIDTTIIGASNIATMNGSTNGRKSSGRLLASLLRLIYSSKRSTKPGAFGCDLTEHLIATGEVIPLVLSWCSQFIEISGIVNGVYRLSGFVGNMDRLRSCFDENRTPDPDDPALQQDVHCVASLLKLYFRELPEPLLTYDLYDHFIKALQPNFPEEVTLASDSILPQEQKISNLKNVIRKLKPSHYRTLEYLLRHLNRVASHGNVTGMTSKNLAIVWAPNLLRCKDLDAREGVTALHLIGIQAVVTEYLIRFVDQMFIPNDIESRKKLIDQGASSSKLIDVGGGPRTLPPKYHTIITRTNGTNSTRIRRSSSTTTSVIAWGTSGQSSSSSTGWAPIFSGQTPNNSAN